MRLRTDETSVVCQRRPGSTTEGYRLGAWGFFQRVKILSPKLSVKCKQATKFDRPNYKSEAMKSTENSNPCKKNAQSFFRENLREIGHQ